MRSDQESQEMGIISQCHGVIRQRCIAGIMYVPITVMYSVCT